MKNLIYLISLISLSIFSQNENKFSINFQNGIGINKTNYANKTINGISKRFAINGNLNLKNGLILSTGVGFNNNYFKKETIATIEDFNFNFIDIPIELILNFNNVPDSNINLYASLGFKYNIFSDIESELNKISITENNISFITGLGGNFKVSKNIFLNIFYGFSNDLKDVTLSDQSKFRLKNDQKIYISVGYSF
ncbi:outer membrane beta-barrel protein [Polaribacter sp.]|uniref:outer membrane beta-barrel protein n=1 Tax=Polaribacter sp. TaxID=1920175 RepID=UPI004048C6A7